MPQPERAGLARWLRRTDTHRLVAHVLVIGALLTGLLVVALDHHGAERIPSHTHLTISGVPVPSHLHGFESVHRHDHPITSVDASSVALYHVDAATDSTTSFVSFGLSVLALALLAAVMSGTSRLRSSADLMRAQLTIRPLVHPPSA